jgi:hypothetical protein
MGLVRIISFRTVILVSLAMVVVFVGVALALPPSANVTNIETFLECLKNQLDGKQATVADAVQCIPKNCRMTLTMSNQSAQRACSLASEEGTNRCQFPRVIFNCDGPPRFQPSFLLCPRGSEAGGELGANRIEIGEAVDAAGNLRMADVPIDPGIAFEALTVDDVISKVEGEASAGRGTKGCNACHTSAGAKNGERLSEPITPFQTFRNNDNEDINLAPFIISTDEPNQEVKPGTDPTDPDQQRQLKQQSLTEVCDCIRNALEDGNHEIQEDGEQGKIALALCEKLDEYRKTRGFCVKGNCSDGAPLPSGPRCSDPGRSCDPFTGGFENDPTGYTCQFVSSSGQHECRSSVMCGDYSVRGGGKFLKGRAVTTVRMDASGVAASETPSAFLDTLDIVTSMEVYNYTTRALISSIQLASLQGSSSGADFTVTGEGTAKVNGTPTKIKFEAKKNGSVLTFEIKNADTGVVLGGGTGEANRSAIEMKYLPF